MGRVGRWKWNWDQADTRAGTREGLVGQTLGRVLLHPRRVLNPIEGRHRRERKGVVVLPGFYVHQFPELWGAAVAVLCQTCPRDLKSTFVINTVHCQLKHGRFKHRRLAELCRNSNSISDIGLSYVRLTRGWKFAMCGWRLAWTGSMERKLLWR